MGGCFKGPVVLIVDNHPHDWNGDGDPPDDQTILINKHVFWLFVVEELICFTFQGIKAPIS